MRVLRGLGCQREVKRLIVTSRKGTITAWSAGVSSRLASNHGLHGFSRRRTLCLYLMPTESS